MTWNLFVYFALSALAFWATGAVWAWRNKPRSQVALATGVGLVVFAAFIALLWLSLGRPPLRTMGETRLWYSFFLPLVGVVTYVRWGYRWLPTFSTVLATVFICVNLFNPDIHNKTLMPALQSPWFVPHVIVYMFAYALTGAAAVAAVWALWFKRGEPEGRDMSLCDELVRLGFAFLTVGMLFGALWAKEAWGHYWAWDPKETWAAITWLAYLVYIHFRYASPRRHRASLYLLLAAFLALQVCWYGINYLPSAQGKSVHTYNMN